MTMFRAIFVAFVLSVNSNAWPFTWKSLESTSAFPGLARRYGGLAYVRGQLCVFGGEGQNGTALSDLFCYNTSSMLWSGLNDGPALYGFVHGYVTRQSRWYVTHGRNDTAYSSATWAYSFEGDRWMELNTSALKPRARYGSAGGTYGDQLFLSMGWSAGGRRLSDTWALNTTSGVWSELAAGGGLNQYNPFLPHARSMHAGAVAGPDQLVMFSGCASGGQVGGACPLWDTWVLRNTRGSWVWSKLDDDCTAPRIDGSMVAMDTELLLLLEGSTGASSQVLSGSPVIIPSGEVSVLNLTANRWLRFNTSDVFPLRRGGALVTSHLTTVYMFGGRNESGTFLKDLWKLEVTVDEISTDVPLGCPALPFSFVHLHGVLMAAAWLLFFPTGALIGRYYRWTWPVWFVAHIVLQVIGTLLMVCAFVSLLIVSEYSPDFPHAVIGIVLTALTFQQFLNGILHPCVKREDGKQSERKGAWRHCWEVYHAVCGVLIIVIGLGQVVLGALLVSLSIYLLGLTFGLVTLWFVVFAVHETIFVCYNCFHETSYTKF
ncbi:hypothetical protein EMCRGX_G011109 [Ephydatia muelleri]